MTLKSLVKGKQDRPMRVLLYGVEGIGKSTFASESPSPIFIGAEDGTSQLDVTRFPQPTTWLEVLDAVDTLTNEDHQFKTLVVDTLDWAEPMLWAHICERDKMANVEAYGYGKGYAAALDEWRAFLSRLEALRTKKEMHLIFLAHSWIKPFKNPEGDDFDRYELKLHPKAGGLMKEWCDVVLFSNFETFAEKDSRTKRIKGVSTGSRLIYTARTAAYDAKNRYDLPESLPLEWEDFSKAVKAHRPADPKSLQEEIERKAALVGGETQKKALDAVKRAGGDAVKLSQLNAWLNGRMAIDGVA